MSDFRANYNSGPSLLDKSTAKPGSVDMSIFESKKKLAPGLVSSNYLEQCRKDNPEPVSKAIYTLVLSDCRLISDPDEFQNGEEFRASCHCKLINNYNPTKLIAVFTIECSYNSGDKEVKVTYSDEFPSLLEFGKSEQILNVKGIVPSRKEAVAPGTKFRYRIKVFHPEAEKPEYSEYFEFQKNADCHAFSLNPICFPNGSHISCIGPEWEIICFLSDVFDFYEENPDSYVLVVSVNGGRGQSDLSLLRGKLISCLIAQDFETYGKLASENQDVITLQTILTELSNSHGWSCDPRGIDGVFGNNTRRAVKIFQQQASQIGIALDCDGICGPKTWASIGRVICQLITDARSGREIPKVTLGNSETSGALVCEPSIDYENCSELPPDCLIQILFYGKQNDLVVYHRNMDVK